MSLQCVSTQPASSLTQYLRHRQRIFGVEQFLHDPWVLSRITTQVSFPRNSRIPVELRRTFKSLYLECKKCVAWKSRSKRTEKSYRWCFGPQDGHRYPVVVPKHAIYVISSGHGRKSSIKQKRRLETHAVTAFGETMSILLKRNPAPLAIHHFPVGRAETSCHRSAYSPVRWFT